MNKEPLLARLPNFIVFPIVYCVLVPLVHAMMWWSEHIEGVESKSGQDRYDHKTVDGQQYFRHAGLRHRFDEWKPVPEIPAGFVSLDICSMYPSVIRIS